MQPPLHVGCDVLCSFGWGFVSRAHSRASGVVYEVQLDWVLASGKRVVAFLNGESIVRASRCPVGAGVLTIYGSGVCVGYDRGRDVHKVRLWQAHAQAGGSALAFLRPDAIISTLPTAVGLFARTQQGTGKVIAYSQATDSFTVEMSDGSIATVPRTDPELSSPEMKVLPSVEYLTEQTQAVWAKQMRNIILSEQSQEVWSKFDGLWKQLQSGESSLQEVLASRAMQMKDQLQGVNSEQLGASLRQQADEFVRDGKVRDLVHQARVRLQELVDSEEARAKYTGVGWEKFMALVNKGKEQLNQLTDGTISQDDALKGVHEAFSAVNDLAKSDPRLSSLLGELQARRSELLQYTQKAAATRAAKAVGEGSKELASRVENLWNSPELAQVKELSTRVLGKLTSKDSAGRTKAAELLQGAKALIFKRMADSEESVVEKLNERLISYLQNWDSHASPWASTVDDRLTQTTLLLQMLGEGSISSGKVITSAQAHLSLASQSSWRLFASQRVEQVLLTMLQREELATGRSISGRELLARFEAKPTARSVTQTITRAISDKLSDSGAAAPVKKFLRTIASTGSVNEAVDVAVQSLDTDEAEDLAKQWLGKGERVLSNLERWRGHDAVKGVVDKLQEWDIENKVLRNIEQLDTTAVLQHAESAITDAEARSRLVNQLKDSMLDFLLQYLPSMSIPDVEGVRDDIEYGVSNLDMSGFKLQKEDVTVELWRRGTQAGDGAEEGAQRSDDEVISIRAQNIAAKFERLHWKYRQLYFPYMQGAGGANATVENASIRLGFKLVRVPSNTLAELSKIVAASEGPLDQPLPTPTKPAMWSEDESKEQTYESVLMLTSRDIMMERLTLVVEGTAFAWLINLLVSVFTDAIKDYICRMLVLTLTQNASHLLRVVNGFVHQYWGMVCKAIGIRDEQIPIATQEDLDTLYQDALTERDMKRAARLIAEQNVARDYTLAFMEPGPLGLHLDLIKPADMTAAQLADPALRAGFLEVAGSAEDSQAEKAIAKLGLAPYIKKAIVTAVNGKPVKNMPPQMGLQLIREASRPLYLDIKLEETAWRFLRDTKRAQLQAQAQAAVAAAAAAAPGSASGSSLARSASEQQLAPASPSHVAVSPASAPHHSKQADGQQQRRNRPLMVVKVQFGDGPLGLKLKENRSCGGAVIVTGFARDESGNMLQAEASGRVKEGMIMLSVGGQLTFGRSFEQCIQILKQAPRPVEITFVASPDRQVLCQEPPTDMELASIQGHIMITAFKHVPGVLSRLPHPPKVGDVIVAINGVELPTGAGYSTDVQMLKDLQPPWTLRVTRQEKGGTWSEHEFTITEAGKLGVALGRTKDGRPFIKSYKNLPGPAQLSGKIVPGAVLLQINSTRIEQSATPEDCFRLMTEAPPPVKVYIRDMDLFMHLIRLRDGEERLEDTVEERGS